MHTDGRKALKEGRWAFVFRGAARVPGPVAQAETAAIGEHEIILHVAMQVLSPWRPTWHRLRRTEAPVGNPPASHTRIYTKVE